MRPTVLTALFGSIFAVILAMAAAGVPATVLAQDQGAQNQADWRASGPQSLILSYKVVPSARLRFRATVRASMLPRLERLRAAGTLESFHLLANRYLDGPWDVMAVLNFRRAEDLAQWRAVEAKAPSGLDEPALRLVSSAEAAPSDRMRTASRPTGSGRAPVYLVVPYDYTVSTDNYLAYIDGYVVPQLDGWMQDRALGGYDVYFARYYAGRPWTSMLLLAYDGDEGLARRDAVVKAVRARLSSQPAWERYAESKQSVRLEKEAIIADELLAPTSSRSR